MLETTLTKQLSVSKEIEAAIKTNNLVIFAGSGLSIKFGLPNWNKMVTDLIQEIDKENFNVFIPVIEMGSMSPLHILDYLNSEHTLIRKYIKKNFKVVDGDFTLHQSILKLTDQIVTTNFDNAFEKASGNTIEPTNPTSKFNISLINKQKEKYILKLHGSYTEPDNCVVFKDDYKKLYSKHSATKEKLKSIFSEKTILFIGFSFNDPDVNEVFNGLDSIFGNNIKHFILTVEPEKFRSFNFLEPIVISSFGEINSYIDFCLAIKAKTEKTFPLAEEIEVKEISSKKRIAVLSPNPIDIKMDQEISQVISCFDALHAIFCTGTLNFKTLNTIEDFDLIIIITKTFKSKLYFEDDNLKSDLTTLEEIKNSIPNEEIPIVFITDKKIGLSANFSFLHISSFKPSIIKRFIYKALKKGQGNFVENEIFSHDFYPEKNIIKKGKTEFTSYYGNNKILEIGKKSLTNIIGRIEEQSLIALKLISISKSNKLLNLKASGGTGKTTLIKKGAYELYNRGYYTKGVNFKSCETVKDYEGFEEILIDGFNLKNIINFREHLMENFSSEKLDLLIILDNFESVVNNLSQAEIEEVISLLKFATDYASIVITSREKISKNEDFEDVFVLTPLITDDALELFQEYYGEVKGKDEIRILRSEILEDLLNNNPLAIKLVTNSRTRFRHINELKQQLKENFFESTNEEFSKVFERDADLNIERTKSIYQSINYSYSTLEKHEKLAFQLLSLFPDGISLSNFKKCFQKNSSSHNITDKHLRVLRDKSLLEDYNGTLQLQPILRRFAEFQFKKQPKKTLRKFCLDAYLFNCFILDLVEFVGKRSSGSGTLKIFNLYKNNLLYVLQYIPDIEIQEKGEIPEKKYLLNYIDSIDAFIMNDKEIREFKKGLKTLNYFFSDLEHADVLLQVLEYYSDYFHNEFDTSYKNLVEIFQVTEMENRIFEKEDIVQKIYRDKICNIHSMEGHTLKRINLAIKNEDYNSFLEGHLFYLGIPESISKEKEGFYHFEYALMLDNLKVSHLENYIKQLHEDQNLEIMQCTYTLSKVTEINKTSINKLVVTNPYTKGLKELMLAFITNNHDKKINHYKNALQSLSHIKYYYLEGLYYFCVYLKEVGDESFKEHLEQGINLSNEFRYQYLEHLFENLSSNKEKTYEFNFSYYDLPSLERYVVKHNENWLKEFERRKI